MMFARSVLPAPVQPPQEDIDQINTALRALLLKQDPSLQSILDKYPAYSVASSEPRRYSGFVLRPPARAVTLRPPSSSSQMAGVMR
jgi:hypothetical protein